MMKKLNRSATQIFCALIQAMNGKPYLKIFNDPFMPLTIEKVGDGVQTPWGIGRLYSFCHYYQQSGDLMQDPEMCFVFVDNRSIEMPEIEFVEVYPYMFQQANLGIYQESVIIENNKLEKFNRKQQRDHTVFANQWLRNIQNQGFLKQIDHADNIQFSD